MKSFYNLSDMTDRTAMITGASGNLGKTISSTLAELGSNLILVDQSTDDLELLKQSIEKKWSVRCHTFTCNLEIQSSRTELIQYVKKEKIP